MLYSKKLICNSKESNRVKVNLDTLNYLVPLFHHEGRRAGLFSINVRVEKILPVHRQGGLNFGQKTIGSGVVYHLFVQMKIRNCYETFSSKMPKILRNF